MKFVNVTIPDETYEPRNVALTGNTLISLYEHMSEKRFGLINVSHKDRKQALLDYSKNIVKAGGAKLYIDSGGYSIITGKVPFHHIGEFEDYYFDFMENEVNNYDYIFSLDIPWGITDDWLQDKKIIESLNHRVIDKTIKAMKRNPAIRDKFYFIHHFKMLDQYQIWQKLCEELDVNNHIVHRAIGGLVNLKGMARHVEFTSFTPMIFRLFHDYLEAGKIVDELRIHILGVYLPYERFVIALAEQILNLYAEEKDLKTRVAFTYDSTNPAQQAWNNSKTMWFYSYQNHALSRFRYHAIPPAVLQAVYGPAMNHAQMEIGNLQSGNPGHKGKKRMDNANAFIPMAVHSQLELDKFLTGMIGYHRIMDILAEEEPEAKLTTLRESLQKNFYGTDIFPDHIEFDLKVISRLRRWLFGSRDTEKLEDFIQFFIKSMNFPAYLK